MPDVIFADPTTTMDTNTQKVLSILPPIQEKPPTPVASTPIQRPIDNHATPHNLPPIQQQIQETAQPYRPQPIYDDKPSGGTTGGVNTLMKRPLTPGQESARDAAAEGAAYELGFALTGLYDGLTGQASDNTNLLLPRDGMEDGAYELGRNAGDLLRDSLKQTGDEIKELRDNPPHFEIPQLKIPTPDLTKIPKFEFPELPEFKIPGFKFPQAQDKDRPNPDPKTLQPTPKPIPKNNERQLRELELSACGSIEFTVLYTSKLFGFYWVPNSDNTGGHFERIVSAASAGEVLSAAGKNANFPSGMTIQGFAEGGGADGSQLNIDMGNGSSYTSFGQIGNSVNGDGSSTFDEYIYPVYFATPLGIRVNGKKDKISIGAILDRLFNVPNTSTEVYGIVVSSSNAKDCPLGKSPPPPEEPPPPPEKKMCCPEIDYRRIKAMIDDAISKLDLVAAIPMSWQIRNEGNKPQLIIQCAEENGVDKEGKKKYKSAMYPISVPHWDGAASDKISLPSYVKGNYEGIYTLNDNSKVTINAQNETECKRILNAIKPRIPKQYTTDAYFKGGLIVRDKPIKESRVKPRYGRYFKDGQKNNKPDWRVDFT
jgi:hypothetical protein